MGPPVVHSSHAFVVHVFFILIMPLIGGRQQGRWLSTAAGGSLVGGCDGMTWGSGMRNERWARWLVNTVRHLTCPVIHVPSCGGGPSRPIPLLPHGLRRKALQGRDGSSLAMGGWRVPCHPQDTSRAPREYQSSRQPVCSDVCERVAKVALSTGVAGAVCVLTAMRHTSHRATAPAKNDPRRQETAAWNRGGAARTATVGTSGRSTS